MKTPKKKVLRGFRIAEDVSSELKARSERTGISEARIVEDALKFHFNHNMQDQLKKVIAAFEKGAKSPFEVVTSGSGYAFSVSV